MSKTKNYNGNRSKSYKKPFKLAAAENPKAIPKRPSSVNKYFQPYHKKFREAHIVDMCHSQAKKLLRKQERKRVQKTKEQDD